MASTRQIRIYQDPSIDTLLQDTSFKLSYNQEILLEPSLPTSDGHSPLKHSQPKITPSKAPCRPLNTLSLPCPKESKRPTDDLEKSFHVTAYHPPLRPILDTAVFGDLPTFNHIDRVNIPHSQHGDNRAVFPPPAPEHTSLDIERVNTTIAPRQSRIAKPSRPQTSIQPCLPDPSQLPNPEDSFGKPNYSYAALIGMAILRADNRRLTLSQIYKWISDTFSYYPISEQGWQNSIRHNLSINKAFRKQERPRNDPGKGNYWTITPGMEAQFLKEKPSRRQPSTGGPTMKTFSQPLNQSSSSVWSTSTSTAPKSVPQAPAVSEQPSSDATLPASDEASPEDFPESTKEIPPPMPRIQMSSPSSPIGSSPPVALLAEFDESSPCLASDMPLPSIRPWTRKRKITAMDDSGYFSSLDSSVSKGPVDGEADRPRLKRGRAEEEIARIRSSSHDLSPTKGRSVMKLLTPQLDSSSPLLEIKNSEMPPPPLTPAVTFSLPAKLSASASPLTQLKIHRNQVKESQGGSPPSDMGILGDECIFDVYAGSPLDFTIFEEPTECLYPRAFTASPEKRSARRSRLADPSKSGSILADVTCTASNRTLLPQPFASPYLDSPIRKKSPAKCLLDQENRDSPTKGSLFDYLDDDEEYVEFCGFDIKQGFPGIGRDQNPAPTGLKATRPLLGARSHTSRL
ncbi:MAG: hypothetical protein Q9186_006921 [Xanthomendoza sp. 1 TL-2023]